jgi:micrococcal nuclease
VRPPAACPVFRLSLCLTLGLLPALPAFAAALHAKVVGILDGDTIDVLENGRTRRVRLDGIDCPEKKQPFGDRAKQATADLAFGKQVRIDAHGDDQHGRLLGEVFLPDERSLNEELVRQGMAWWYRKYAPHNTKLRLLEEKARDAGMGLWADAHPVPPWEWRRQQKIKQ